MLDTKLNIWNLIIRFNWNSISKKSLKKNLQIENEIVLGFRSRENLKKGACLEDRLQFSSLKHFKMKRYLWVCVWLPFHSTNPTEHSNLPTATVCLRKLICHLIKRLAMICKHSKIWEFSANFRGKMIFKKSVYNFYCCSITALYRNVLHAGRTQLPILPYRTIYEHWKNFKYILSIKSRTSHSDQSYECRQRSVFLRVL